MNYQKHHDAIIDRARSRTYDRTIHQKHHIIPLHEDSSSTETVCLTYKEHYIVHLLRWKMTGTIGNYKAYLLMRSFLGEEVKKIQLMAGKIGGAKTKENSSGIFSSNWNRSAETTMRWQTGIIDRVAHSKLMKNGLAKKAGNASVAAKKGIHSGEWDHSVNLKLIWAKLDTQQREKRLDILKQNGIKGAQRSKELGTNFSSWSKEKQRAVASKGGKAHKGKKVVNNGIEQRKLMPEEATALIAQGWVRGYIKRNKEIK